MTEQVRLCAVWPTENWPGSSTNHMDDCLRMLQACFRKRTSDGQGGDVSCDDDRILSQDTTHKAKMAEKVSPVTGTNSGKLGAVPVLVSA